MVDKLINIFSFSADEPLLFTRFYFWAFFAVVMAFFSILYKKRVPRNAYLFVVSLFFYYKSSGIYFLILLFSTVSDFLIGMFLHYSRSKIERKLLLLLSVLLNLAFLSYFKYSYLFIDTINYTFGTNFEVVNFFNLWVNTATGSYFEIDKIILPVGISFFTFQTMSYTLDLYRKRIKPVTNVLDFGFYVSFFPQLVAGPIVRASEFIPQLYKEYNISKRDFGIAIFMILNGLLKKLFISDYIAVNLIDRVFGNPETYSGYENLMALYAYSMQVYADFSGYTDIAIGVALLMGFRLPVNFNSPYKSLHVGEFWKRWHISLSSWLKDYLYIPLGGNKTASIASYLSVILLFVTVVIGPGWNTLHFVFMSAVLLLFFVGKQLNSKPVKYLNLALIVVFLFFLFDTNWFAFIFLIVVLVLWIISIVEPESKITISTDINLLITMLLGGLWHGASWQFVIWGGINGIGLVIYKQWRKISPFKGNHSWAVRFYAILLTFNFITLTRIWFRGESMEKVDAMVSQIVNAFDVSQIWEITLAYKNVFVLLILAYVVHWLPAKFKLWYRNYFANLPLWAMSIIVLIVVFFIYQFQTFELQPFIYFQF